MGENQGRPIGARTASSVASGCKGALRTIWFLLLSIIPVTLAVSLLDWLGVLSWFARLMSPLMSIVGLPGGTFLALAVSGFLNIYCAVAVALSMSLDMRSATILAIMCLTAHSLIVETAIMKRTGSSGIKMVFLRIAFAFAAAYAFNLLLPDYLRSVPFPSHAVGAARPAFFGMPAAWGRSAASFVVKIGIIVLGVSVAQKLLEEFKAMDFLSRLFAPAMRFLGLPRESCFPWIAINVVGYSYGAGIAEERVKAGSMKPQEADLFNHHACVCHSLMEDTVLLLVFGVPLFWITLPRIAFALVAVWIERARRRVFRRSFRVGTV
jgi:hypothetical protein